MTLFGSTMKGSWIHETLKMLDETRLASPRHDLWREENFSVELEISPNNEQREKSQKYFRFHFRVQKILNDIFDSWVPPPLFLLLGQLLLSPRKRERGCPSRDVQAKQANADTAMKITEREFRPLPPPPFSTRFLAHRKPGRCPSTLFFPFLHTLDRLERIVFFFHSSQRIFLPGNIRQTLVGETRMTNGGGGGGRERPLLQPVAHFGRWNGSSFEEVEKKNGGDNIYT